jgi:4-amino-4-deoxy-L-arabinose transferase-like glycosyltransferase
MRSKLILIGILILGFALRLYKIDSAVADNHSWRQADTAAVARNYIKEGWDFLRPRIDNMTPLHPGQPNDQRLFLVEPPIYNSIVTASYNLFSVQDRYARLVSILFSLGSVVFLYFITSKYLGERAGLLSAFFFAVLPYSVFYSRVVLPEPMIIFLNLGMLYFAIKWLEDNTKLAFTLFTFFSMLSFSQKAFPLFLLLPLFYLVFKRFGLGFLKKKELYLWLILSLLPLVLWRYWISHFPEGIPANLWLFNEGNIRFKGAFFHWIFAERIGKLILGYFGLPLLALGLALKPKKEGLFYYSWLLSIFLYVIVFAAGNVTHDYYQIPLIPILCVFMAKGVDFLLFEKDNFFSRIFSTLLVFTCIAFMLAFSWFEIRGFYNIKGGVDLAGVAVNELASKDALVLTGDSNDATLLYNTNRWGWSGGFASNFPNSRETIEKIIRMGGDIYVTTKFEKDSDFGKYMLDNFEVMKETNQYIIFDLDKK